MFNFDNLKQKVKERDSLKALVEVRRNSNQEVLEKIQNFIRDIPTIMDFCKNNGLSSNASHNLNGKSVEIVIDGTDFTLTLDKNSYFDIISENSFTTPPLVKISPRDFDIFDLEDITKEDGHLKENMKWLYENLEEITSLLEKDLQAELEKQIDQQRGLLDGCDSLEKCEELGPILE